MKEIIISRELVPEEFMEMMLTESHHEHEIIVKDGYIRWKENDDTRHFLENISLNDLCPLLETLGHGKNSEVYRKLYRNMGYSLSGYWEIFYWNMNNPDADEYKQPLLV
jgi:hypothetical protein